MAESRHGMRPINQIGLKQQRVCEICGKPFKKSGLPMCPDALIADCDCMQAIERTDERRRAAEENMRNAKIPRRLATLKFESYPEDREKVDGMERYIRRPNPGLLILVGSVGRGKSSLACGVLERLAERGTVRYYYAFDLLNDRVSRETMDVMREALAPETICIDEIGLQLKTDAAKEFMERLLIGRHDDLKNTILISNLGPDEFKPLVGTRAWDRATNDGMLLVFSGKTFRGRV